MTDKLSATERSEQLNALFDMGWRMVDGRDAIAKTFGFRNFIEAFGWMAKVAIWAEKLDHHPEWSNVYKTVDVVLSTHSVDGLSILDVKLAQKMDALVAS
jgi:4a-hydroxytetrahydrobiopterin dehydratase